MNHEIDYNVQITDEMNCDQEFNGREKTGRHPFPVDPIRRPNKM